MGFIKNVIFNFGRVIINLFSVFLLNSNLCTHYTFCMLCSLHILAAQAFCIHSFGIHNGIWLLVSTKNIQKHTHTHTHSDDTRCYRRHICSIARFCVHLYQFVPYCNVQAKKKKRRTKQDVFPLLVRMYGILSVIHSSSFGFGIYDVSLFPLRIFIDPRFLQLATQFWVRICKIYAHKICNVYWESSCIVVSS